MPTSMEGVGFNLFGWREIRPDGSYISTKFFCILYVPLVPLSSWRVIPAPGNSWVPFMRRRYVRAVRLPLNLMQVLFVYLGVALTLLYGTAFFDYAAPYLQKRSNFIDDGWTEIFVFALWMSAPLLCLGTMKKKAMQRMSEAHRDFNNPRPIS